MSGKNSKKARKQIQKAHERQIAGVDKMEVVPPTDLASFVHGFIVARGYDLHPMIAINDGQVIIDLYHDAGDNDAGPSGFYRITRVVANEADLADPKQLDLSMRLARQLGTQLPQRTPSPMPEPVIRQIRDQLSGALLDGLSHEELAGMVKNLVESLSVFLRRRTQSVPTEVLAKLDADHAAAMEVAKRVASGEVGLAEAIADAQAEPAQAAAG